MAFMKFYVGNEANASSHRDGIYIAVDTKKIFYNGSVYGGSEVDLSNYYTIAQVDDKIGTNVYTGANYISKETNLTEAVLQLDEEIKATNDNLTLEHENAEATYAKKTELAGYLPLAGGTMTGPINFESTPVGNVGDAVLYDKQANKLIIVPTTDDIGTKYPSDNYEPIGVVVIPASHDVYGTGECGVMSLRFMSCTTPDNGSQTMQQMRWGGYEVKLNGLKNCSLVPVGNTEDGSSLNIANTYIGYLPSDSFDSLQCRHDLDSYYPDIATDNRDTLLCPYLNDDSRNPYYYSSAGNLIYNCFRDLDGLENSKVLWDLSTSQSNWKTASTIDNNYDEGSYPAACCCWRYHTKGTQQGDWYLPAMGELGYIMPKLNTIHNTLNILKNVYHTDTFTNISYIGRYAYCIWTSSWGYNGAYSDSYARVLQSEYGVVRNNSRLNNYQYAVAFTRVKPESNITSIIVSGKSDTDLLNGAGGTTSVSDIITQVQAAIVDSAPETLDTLNELAAALGDDPNFATTVSTKLGKKLDISTYTSDKATFALKSDIPNVSNFLTISNAQSTYLTKTDASNIYQPKGSYLTSVSIATISDLNANWDALLKSDPSGYVTRWPNMSEVGSKQNLVIKLNGGTTEGTNQFTYNVTAAKSINITPSSIGAAASSHNHNASQVSGLSKVATSGSYNDLTNKPSIPSAYTLPKATTSTLGGIKVGDGLEITGDGTLNCIIDPGSGTVSWGNIQGKPSVFATNIASINDLNSGWDALLKAAPNIPSLNGYATQEWVNGRGFLTKTTADGYYQPKGNYLTSVSWSQISDRPTILALGTTSSTAFRGDYGNTAYQHAAAKGAAFSSGLYKITTNAQGHVTTATKVVKADITALGIPGSDSNPVFQVYHGETKETLGTSTMGSSLVGVPSIVSSTRTDTTRAQRLSFPDFGLKKDSTGVYLSLTDAAVASRLPTAGSDPGAICLGYPQSGKNYPVELDDNDRAYVNVPWTDTNTTYSAISTSEIDALFS